MSDLTERMAALKAKFYRIRELQEAARALQSELATEALALCQERFDIRPGTIIRLTKNAHPCKAGEEVRVAAVVPGTIRGELRLPSLIVLRKKKDGCFGSREHRLWAAWQDAREPYWEKVVEGVV